ncbi:MAG: hypothetical protein ABRQ39_25780 [Candidatus Eremiobacterota bacterium]
MSKTKTGELLYFERFFIAVKFPASTSSKLFFHFILLAYLMMVSLEIFILL